MGKAGGRSPLSTLDLSSPPVLSAARDSLASGVEPSNSAFQAGLLRVVSGSHQVVSGMRYELVLESRPSSCRKGSPLEDSCSAPAQSGQKAIITASVWVQPWRTPSSQVTLVNTVME